METSKERLERLMQNPAFRKMMEAEMQAEQNYEMTAAFGSGVKLVNVVTGKIITTKSTETLLRQGLVVNATTDEVRLRRVKMKLDTEKKTLVDSKLYFNQFRVYEYADGTYCFENYRPYFKDVIQCLTWGRAYQEAERQFHAARNRMWELGEEVR